MREATDYKQAAIEQWTADPCGANAAGGEPGSGEYFERLLAARHDYAPWMAEELDYAGSTGLEVLDVGCGQGIDVARYAQAGATRDRSRSDPAPRGARAGASRRARPRRDDRARRRRGTALRRRELRSRLEQRRAPPHAGHAGCAGGDPGLGWRRSADHRLQQALLSLLGEAGCVRGRRAARASARTLNGRRALERRRGLQLGARPLVRVYSPRAMRELLRNAGLERAKHALRSRRSARVLRPGGEARIIVYNKRSFHYWLEQVAWEGVVRRRASPRALDGRRALERRRGLEHRRAPARPGLLSAPPAWAPAERGPRAGRDRRPAFPSKRYTRHCGPREPGGALRKPDVLDRIGRVGGWYVIATGRKPAASQ